MSKHIETIKKALESYRGDDLYRARAAFRNKSPEQMQEKYYSSEMTCAEILQGYENHERQVNEAIAFVDQLTSGDPQ